MAALHILLLTFTSRFVIDFLSIRKVIIFSAIATDVRHPLRSRSLHLQMVVILQSASRRPFSMLMIFTVVIMNNCQQDAKSSYFLPFQPCCVIC